MGKRRLTIHELRKILRTFEVLEDRAAGKGSHTKSYKVFPEGRFSYPVPFHGKDVKNCYVDGARRKFHLTVDDGISDDDFYGRA